MTGTLHGSRKPAATETVDDETQVKASAVTSKLHRNAVNSNQPM
jgi:hypothetical protein